MKKILHKWIERYFGTEEALLLTIILVVSLVVFRHSGCGPRTSVRGLNSVFSAPRRGQHAWCAMACRELWP